MKTVVAVVYAGIFIACGPSEKKDPAPSGDPAVCGMTEADLVAVTFNAGLAPGIENHALQRVAPAAERAAALGADILCLQEFWKDEALQAATLSLGLPAANLLVADTRGEEETGNDVCAPHEIDDVMACARANCANVPDIDASICAADNCQSEAVGVYIRAPRCFNCLVASAGNSLDDIAAVCDGGPGASRLYGGRNGVILASAHPLLDVEIVRLPSSGANRVALFASVEGFGPEPIEVACTHLSSSNLIPPTDPRFETWAEEQGAQVDLIAAKLFERAGDRPVLFLGDMNTSPAVDGYLDGSDLDTWEAITDYGFSSPAALAEPPVCTRCPDNLLSPTEHHLLIDHVLTLDSPDGSQWAPLCAQAVMNEPVTIIDSQGASVTTSVSDHFGTLVKLDLP